LFVVLLLIRIKSITTKSNIAREFFKEYDLKHRPLTMRGSWGLLGVNLIKVLGAYLGA
jgi:hypothetical protein